MKFSFCIGICIQQVMLYLTLAEELALQCPVSSQWNLRSRAFCKTSSVLYYCLFDKNNLRYQELCSNQESFHKPGFKYIISGNLNGEPCTQNRFQPFKFSVDGNSECVFLKSTCSEDGQIMHSNGTTKTDISCRCDYTSGYAYVKTPKHSCFCDPIREDCSCYKKSCGKNEVLTADYVCIKQVQWYTDIYCPLIKKKRLKSNITITSASKIKPAMLPSSSLDLSEFKDHKDTARMVILVLVLSTLFVVFWYIIIGKHLIEKCRQCFMMDEIISEKVNEEIIRYKKDQYASSEFVKKNEEDIRRKNIRDIHNLHIHDWMKEDEKFIVTMATHTLFESLERDSCAFVVGIAGNGKSSIIRHIALKLKRQENYEIVPIVLSPEIIFEFRNRDRKQIFIVDDLCGKVNVNAQSVDIWVSQINEILKLIDTADKNDTKDIADVKFLFATRLSIFEDSIFQKLKSLMQYVFLLSKFPLKDEEKLKMINKYITLEADTKLLKKLKSDDAYFPLLCKIAERKTPDQIIKLFSNLKGFIKQDLMELKENNHLQFCIITLCSILSNNFKEEILNDVYDSDIERQAYENICMEFNLGTNKDQVKSKIKAQLSNLDGMYMTKTENYYHFIHAKVYHIAVVVCGQTFLHCFIKYVRSSFIAERFCFQSTMANTYKNTIFINNEDAEKRFFDRLMFDLEKGETYSTFHNNQLENESYRQKFCVYCRTRKEKFSELLKHFSANSELNGNVAETNYDDYIDFRKQYHFFSHKMRRPLIESVWEGYADIVQLLLEFDCNINDGDKYRRTPLFVACLLGKVEVVNVLLQNHAIHSLCDENKQSPLLVASRGGNDTIVKALLEKNADVNLCDFKGNSPLLVASSDSPLSTVKLLSRKITDFSKCNLQGQTPIFTATIHRRIDVLQYLLPFCKEHVSKPDNDGRSPLFIACKKGYSDVVQLLLSNHADLSQSDWTKRRSPLFIAAAKGHADIVNILIQNESNINQCDEEGRTPLFIATEKGHTVTVKILVESGADINKTDQRKCTPLYAACRLGFLDIVQLLNENEANITQFNKWNTSPLFAAYRQGYLEIVKYLVENRSNVSGSDYFVTISSLVASENELTEIVDYLIQNGTDLNQSKQCKKT